MTPEQLLELFDAHPYPVLACAIAVSVGVAQCFFGVVVSLLTAIGTKRYFWVVAILVLGPITALPFALKYGEANYPRSLMSWGLALIGGSVGVFTLLVLI